MVIDKSNNQRENADTRSTKEKLIAEFDNQPESVLALAYMFARGFDLSGEDITKAWTNAVRNNQIIEDVYRRGYTDCEKDYAEKKRRDFYHKVIVDMKL